MTAATRAKIPGHLRRYIVDQNYARYTPEDQAVWRYIMRQLKHFLGEHAHASYLDGLEKTGITVERIPSIDHIDQHLEKIGWGAVPVSGFIPPAAFMEFQSIGILPIASDMRTADHLLYTPAPDIVHEAAGHAPILANPDYAAYLKQYGEIARRAILSREDLEQYEAIRILSDMKEDPRSTAEDIRAAEGRLNEVNSRISFVSEAALLSRMNWWTAEYGLIGDLRDPRIFGAGLLSSVGESRYCLQSSVKKIPLSVDCVNFSYDITEPQPQLFVTRDFAQLGDVLSQLADKLSFKRGGEFGLKEAIRAETVNTVVLDSGIQISGRLKSTVHQDDGKVCYLRFEGPSQLAASDRELPGQGVTRHHHGYSCPLGRLKAHDRPFHLFSIQDLNDLGIVKGKTCELEFTSGILVHGVLESYIHHDGHLILLTFKDCRVTLGSTVLFDPSWGEYDMAVGSEVVSVFGGPADREKFGDLDEFVAKLVPDRAFTPEQREWHGLYARIRDLRERPRPNIEAELIELANHYLSLSGSEWLPGIELIELSHKWNLKSPVVERLKERLRPEQFESKAVQMAVRDGLNLAKADS